MLTKHQDIILGNIDPMPHLVVLQWANACERLRVGQLDMPGRGAGRLPCCAAVGARERLRLGQWHAQGCGVGR